MFLNLPGVRANPSERFISAARSFRCERGRSSANVNCVTENAEEKAVEMIRDPDIAVKSAEDVKDWPAEGSLIRRRDLEFLLVSESFLCCSRASRIFQRNVEAFCILRNLSHERAGQSKEIVKLGGNIKIG